MIMIFVIAMSVYLLLVQKVTDTGRDELISRHLIVCDDAVSVE